ncbi:RfbJ protein [Knoellia sinensis KCTC 19936]|uniref:RfbJ protein n=1 Tax=Knoellia sinensis KCTC 19936 TaxID=1385520 RepID=A0A0A0J041_9MICO|nr:glycosyltransferase [Knoellia sinensis]KGN30438.1 RfbJ protein [Knoellia sinensis KCTC 19936]
MHITEPTIAVIVPCFNEEAAIGTVVEDLRAALPTATIYVYDNNSSDGTREVAAAAGAVVRTEMRRGKGNVVRRAFGDIEADVYLMIDGDNTYDAAAAPQLVKTLLENHLDHVVGVRVQESTTAYRAGHATGNKALTGVVGALFGRSFTDMLSGYRAFSRRYVKSFPALSREFEVETELTIHSLHLRIPVAEVPVGFKDRPDGSESKLRTYRDGWKILNWILRVTRVERPGLFHGVLAGILALVSIVLAIPVISEYLRTGLVPRFPTAILATAIMTIAVLTFALGYVLDAIRHAREENARLSYLRLPAPGWVLDARR